jgi:pimeloyl-ACP methyl ester carboxylesterase
VQSTTGVARRDTADGPIELFYEDLGDPAGPTVLLIMGLGAQLPMWPDGFCTQLVTAGYRVIRFDHRDSGLSAKLDGHLRAVRCTHGSRDTPSADQAGCRTRW